MISKTKHRPLHAPPKDYIVVSPSCLVAPTASSIAQQSNSRKLSSQRLNPNKSANPFETNVRACKSIFSQSYVTGSIPCRLQSSASRYSLQWDPAAVNGFSPDLLVVCAAGLVEDQHPYSLMAPMMFWVLKSGAL